MNRKGYITIPLAPPPILFFRKKHFVINYRNFFYTTTPGGAQLGYFFFFKPGGAQLGDLPRSHPYPRSQKPAVCPPPPPSLSPPPPLPFSSFPPSFTPHIKMNKGITAYFDILSILFVFFVILFFDRQAADNAAALGWRLDDEEVLI